MENYCEQSSEALLNIDLFQTKLLDLTNQNHVSATTNCKEP